MSDGTIVIDGKHYREVKRPTTTSLFIRVTAEEHSAVKAAAGKAGVSINQYCRRVLAESTPQPSDHQPSN